jgi:DNA-binding beta-propeller fold protein YncE
VGAGLLVLALWPARSWGQQVLYEADDNGLVNQITSDGTVSLFASGLDGPYDLAFNSTGTLFVANAGNNTIAEVTPGGIVSTFVTSGLNGPVGLAFNSTGTLFVANNNDGSIDEVTPGGSVSTFVPGGTGLSTEFLAFAPVPEPAETAAILGAVALTAVGWRKTRQRRVHGGA